MKDLIFCSRCRGMEVGVNRSYIRHRLTCGGGFARSFRFLAVLVVVLGTIVLVPTRAMSPGPVAAPADVVDDGAGRTDLDASVGPTGGSSVVAAVEDLLGRHTRVSGDQRARIARAVVASGRRYGVDPFLVTGILVAESSGNAYAISSRQAVGIMQIHVPTWGEIAEEEGLNLFLLEDNVDLGTRILQEYTSRYGLREGLMRYLGASDPTPQALAYVQRVEGIYTERQAD